MEILLNKSHPCVLKAAVEFIRIMSDSCQLYDVLLPVAFDRTLSYAAPLDGVAVAVGDYVRVPLGSREVVGVIWQHSTGVAPKNLKNILHRFDAPPMREELRHFIDWVANYTLSPKGLVLRISLAGTQWLEDEPTVQGYTATSQHSEHLNPARTKIMELMRDGQPRRKAQIMREAHSSASTVDKMVEAGLLQLLTMPANPPFGLPDSDHFTPALNASQQHAVKQLCDRTQEQAFSVTLLEGVTGAGKTEVYLEAVSAAIRNGQQALVLLPEIALTKSVLKRLEQRFGAPPQMWHSGLTPAQRARICRAVASGEAKIVVGARSALFLPFANLGLIIADEEHDSSYKQEEMPIYNGRDMAVVRARCAAVAVILVSATPSLETQVNALVGRYHHVRLTERFGGQSLPDVTLVDMVKTPPPKGRFIAPAVEAAISQTLERREQALLFLNRRGYAPLTLCRACGHRFACKSCSAWLVEHRFRKELICHHCGYHEPMPHVCPACKSSGQLVPCGPGVERLQEEAQSLFPEARVCVLSSDSIAPEALQQQLEEVAAGNVDIVVGTQLVAKGHNFPHLTLVGVIDADMSLGTNDPRAAERTFQLLDQVSGRAGRFEKPGRALLQTFEAEHPVMKALAGGSRETFYATERHMREAAKLPPFGRLAALVVSAPERTVAIAYARALAQAFPVQPNARLLGPAEAPLALVRGKHRQRLLLKADIKVNIPILLREWLAVAPKPKAGVMVTVDVDPLNFL